MTNNIKGFYEKPYHRRPGWKPPKDIEGMSPAKAIMDHFVPGGLFTKDEAVGWVTEKGYEPESANGPLSNLLRNDYIGLASNVDTWPRKFLMPFGPGQLQPVRRDAHGDPHEGQHRPDFAGGAPTAKGSARRARRGRGSY